MTSVLFGFLLRVDFEDLRVFTTGNDPRGGSANHCEDHGDVTIDSGTHTDDSTGACRYQRGMFLSLFIPLSFSSSFPPLLRVKKTQDVCLHASPVRISAVLDRRKDRVSRLRSDYLPAYLPLSIRCMYFCVHTHVPLWTSYVYVVGVRDSRSLHANLPLSYSRVFQLSIFNLSI